MMLTQELNNERMKTNQLINELNIEKQKNFNLTNQINSYMNMVNQLNYKIKALEIELNSKKVEIQNLINFNNNELNKLLNTKSSLEHCKTGEKIIAIQFSSIDQKVYFITPCKNTDIFVKLEEKLYNEYPEYKDFNTYFTVGGITIKRFKSMQENNIKNSDVILLNIYE